MTALPNFQQSYSVLFNHFFIIAVSIFVNGALWTDTVSEDEMLYLQATWKYSLSLWELLSHHRTSSLFNYLSSLVWKLNHGEKKKKNTTTQTRTKQQQTNSNDNKKTQTNLTKTRQSKQTNKTPKTITQPSAALQMTNSKSKHRYLLLDASLQPLHLLNWKSAAAEHQLFKA